MVHLLDDRSSAPAINVQEDVQRLNSGASLLGTRLAEREEQVKYALNRWIDFQTLYKELESINEWFEEREEAMSRYQKIVTHREFEIALEDVKVCLFALLFG